MSLTIPLPTITATWVQVDPDDASMYIHSWDLVAKEVPEQLCRVMGFSVSFQDAKLIAWVDQLDPNKGDAGFHVNVPGLSGGGGDWKIVTYDTLEEAQAAVHKALGVTP